MNDKANTVTVHTDDGRHRVSPRRAAFILVDTYGWQATEQEIVANRKAFWETWREVEELLAERADAADLQAEMIRILKRGQGPSMQEMIDLISDWGGDLATCPLDRHK